jgi:hypothetical protein
MLLGIVIASKVVKAKFLIFCDNFFKCPQFRIHRTGIVEWWNNGRLGFKNGIYSYYL